MDESKILDRYILNSLFRITLKYAPAMMAVSCVINTTGAYFGYDTAVLSYVSGISLIPWLFMLVASIVFRYCIYHRFLLYYIMIDNIINIIDYYIVIPVEDYKILMIHYILLGVIVSVATYKHVRKIRYERKRQNITNTRDGGVREDAM